MKSLTRHAKPGLFALFLLGLGIWMAFEPTLSSGFRSMQVDIGDTRLLHYLLEHGYQWVRGNPSHPSFWDAPMFYPVRNTAAYADTLLGTAPPYWGLRALGASPDIAFDLWMMIQAAFDYLAALLLLTRGMGFACAPAAIGAFLFSFGSPRIAQLGHQQLLAQYWVLLSLYCLIRAFKTEPSRSAWPWVAGASVCAALQFYNGFYLEWFFVFGLALFFVVSLARADTRPRLLSWVKNQRVTLALGLVLWLALIAPLLVHYLRVAQEYGTRPWPMVHGQVPRLQSWFYLGPGSLLYFWENKIRAFAVIPMPNEQAMGLGLVTLWLAIAGLVSVRKRTWMAPLCAACVILFFLATHIFFVRHSHTSPWFLVYSFVPGGKSLRAVARVILLFIIPFSIGIAAFFSKPRALWLNVVLLCLVVAEQKQTTYSFDRAEMARKVAAVTSQLTPQCGYFYYRPLAPLPDAWVFNIDAMWASLETGIPTLNGYSGNGPLDEARLLDLDRPLSESDVRTELAGWSARHGLDPKKGCWVR